MKSNFLLKFLTFILLMPLFSGCKNEVLQIPDIVLGTTEKTIPAEGGQSTVFCEIENPIPGVNLTASCSAGWIKNLAYQDGIGKLSFFVDENPGAARSAEVLLKYQNARASLIVKQEKKVIPDPIIKVKESSVNADAEGGIYQISFEIINPVQGAKVEITCSSGWLGQFDCDDDAGKLSFAVQKNTGEKRQCTVKLIYQNTSASFKVNQKATNLPDPEIRLDRSVVEVFAEGGQYVVHYDIINPIQGIELKAECSEEWVKNLGIDSEKQQIWFNVDTNKKEEDRKAVVDLKYKKINSSFVIEQEKRLAPEIKLSTAEMTVPGCAGRYSVSYELINPVANSTLSAYALLDEEITDIEFNDFEGTLSFSITNNPYESLTRNNIIVVEYKNGGEVLASARIKVKQEQNNGKLPEIKLKEKQITVPGTAGRHSVTYEIINPVITGKMFAYALFDEDIYHLQFNESEGTLTFSITANPYESTERENTIFIEYKSDGAVLASTSLKVIQRGNTTLQPKIVADPSISIPIEGGESFKVNYKIENPVAYESLHIDCDASWISGITDAVNGDGTGGMIVFDVEPNEEFSSRAAVMNLRYKDATATVIISQSSNTYTGISVSRSVVEALATPGEYYVEYEISNEVQGAFLRVTCHEYWITNIKVNEIYHTVSFFVEENDREVIREGIITLEYGIAKTSFTVHQAPKEPDPDQPKEPEIKPFTVNGVPFAMVEVQGGIFKMGERDPDLSEEDCPIRLITLSDYYIGQTEVTQELWKTVMDNNPSYFQTPNISKNDYSLPVENVSWEEIVNDFLPRLNMYLADELGKLGMKFALPTEAQWEYAARGGNHSKGYRYSGSNFIHEVAWFIDNKSSTNSVGKKSPNELGIYDMSGNVFEWCSDWYGNYEGDALKDPTGPITGTTRVARGGSWLSPDKLCRVTARGGIAPDWKLKDLGFRLVMIPNNQ